MHVLMAGASGLIGRHVVRALRARGDDVTALSRHPDRHEWPVGVRVLAWDGTSRVRAPPADAIVNLAGERVVGHRWTKARKAAMQASRIEVTRRLVEWSATQRTPPHLVSASAAGYYGENAQGPCPESRGPGDGFLAALAVRWEAEAAQARGPVAVLRIGHVLARDGGYLATILPYARRGLAGPLGPGTQPMSWVHVDDLVGCILWALDRRATGTFNVVAPGAAAETQAGFAGAVAQEIGHRRQVRVPEWMVRLRYGAGVTPALLGGQDLRPEALLAAGFQFKHIDLRPALHNLLGRRHAEA